MTVQLCHVFFFFSDEQQALKQFRRAILQGGRQAQEFCTERGSEAWVCLGGLVRHVAYETLPREVGPQVYFDSLHLLSTTMVMLAITIAEVRIKLYY